MEYLPALRSILAKALQAARESNRRMRCIQLALGEIVEVEPAAVAVHWQELSQGTAADGVPLHFRVIQAEVQCMACFQRYLPQAGKIHCPYCGSYGAKVLSGEEFHLDAIEWDE